MSENQIEVECLECEKEFLTSRLKREGEKFSCHHCNSEHSAEEDIDSEGEPFWYANLAPKKVGN